MDSQTGNAVRGINITGLRKRYGEGDTAVDALKGIDMAVAPGEVVGQIGPSGSGKSTLLKCLGAVIEPTAGRMMRGEDLIFDDGWKIRDLRAPPGQDRLRIPGARAARSTRCGAPLDSERALGVIRILNQMARPFDTAIIVVTHDEKIIPTFRRIYRIRDGKTEEEAGEGTPLG